MQRFVAGMGLVLAVMCLNSPVEAQTISTFEEGARVTERFTSPPEPRSTSPSPNIILESTAPPASASTVQLNISDIIVARSSVYTATQLQKMTEGHLGRQSLQAVYELAQTLTARYNGEGYFLSRVIVPPQELDPANASVRLEVVEGWIDEVIWPDEIGDYRDLFSAYSRKITAERPITISTLERYLLLAGDLPGLAFESTLEPSTGNSGASRLTLSVKRQYFRTFAATDNHGTDGRGPHQFSVGLALDNVLRRHESLSGNCPSSEHLAQMAA